MKRLLFFTLILFRTSLMFSQDQLLNDNDLSEAEFHTAINPTNSSNVVLATMHDFEDVDESYFTIYYTFDFGQSWEISDYNGIPDGYFGAGDPVLSFDANGNLYLAHLVVDQNGSILTFISKSEDGGKEWEAVYNYHIQFTDKPWIAVDRSDNPESVGNIYLPTVIGDLILISLDSSLNELNEVFVPDGDQIPCIVTSKSGEIFMSSFKWTSPNELYLQQYEPGGSELVHSSFITSFPDFTFNMFEISSRFQPSPYLAIDNSEGPYSGRLYVAYTGSEQDDERAFNIFLTYSDDKGRSWSTPKIVHEDVTPLVQQYYSSIFVNDNGVLMIDWYDRSNYIIDTDFKTDFMLGISYDGGESFTQVKLNSHPMNFNEIIVAGAGFGIGDYHQMVASDKTALSFWSDGRMNDGDLNIYFAKVDIGNPVGVKEQGLINMDIIVSNPYPQPASSSLQVDFQIKKKLKLKHSILTIDGSLIRQSPFQDYIVGDHSISVDLADLPSGQYIIGLESENGYFLNRKFVVSR